MDQNPTDKVENPKRSWVAPSIESKEVFEQTALACSGVFANALTNFKSQFESCGYNSS